MEERPGFERDRKIGTGEREKQGERKTGAGEREREREPQKKRGMVGERKILREIGVEERGSRREGGETGVRER